MSEEQEKEPLGTYTRKIDIPVYEPSDRKPFLNNLMCTKKRDELLADIDKSDIPEEIKVFLRSSAERHTKFDFAAIADFYAHSKTDVKQLFEDSALVIVDYDDALKNGFIAYQEIVDGKMQTIMDDNWDRYDGQ